MRMQLNKLSPIVSAYEQISPIDSVRYNLIEEYKRPQGNVKINNRRAIKGDFSIRNSKLTQQKGINETCRH
jgi:hypothetical protein